MMVAFYRQANGGAIQLAASSFYMFISRRMEKNLKIETSNNFSTLPMAVLLFLKLDLNMYIMFINFSTLPAINV